jgi:S1-C subfamily serine protease
MKQIFRVLSLPLVLVLILTSLGPSLALDKQRRLKAMSAVVQVWWLWEEDGNLRGVGIGSGTIISANGLILTNAHVAIPNEPIVKYLGIALTVKSDQPPQPAYLAEVAAVDESLDLAVLRVKYDLNRNLVDPEDLDLPHVRLGDSDAIEVGDELNIFGYPGIGGETITFTQGVVSGFSLDASIDGRAWIKTDTTIAGGNSGGMAVDEEGMLVGVPTRAGAGSGSQTVDCRPVADTNGNGRLDDGDSCVPVGGFINALRPVNLARPLIGAARRGIAPTGGQRPGDDGPTPTGQPRFSNLFFSSGVTESDQPTTIITRLPSGASQLYIFFDYENMAADTPWSVSVAIDGRDQPGLGMSGTWGNRQQGTTWVGWTDATLPDGTLEAQFYIDGQETAGAQIEIGGQAQAQAAFENVVFSLEATSQDEPIEPDVVFAGDITSLLAFFDYKNMANGTQWTRTWLLDDQEASSTTDVWDSGRNGRYVLELTSASGLPPGDWRLELYIAGELSTLANFSITAGEGSGPAFTPIVFAEGMDQQRNPIDPARSFASGLERLYALSDYDAMADGMDFTANWYVDGELVIESAYAWDGGESGTWYDYLYSTQGSLPDAEYTLELLLKGEIIQSATTVVGAGTSPTPTPDTGPTEGVAIEGIIIDLDTEQPIPGAVFLVLNPGITYDNFQWTDDEVYTSAQADREGYFQLPHLLARGECYTWIIGAQDYWLYVEDDVCVGDDVPEAVDLTVRLEKQ